MLIISLISWWYGAGWRRQASLSGERLASMMDYFSIDLLLKTLFSPFRQISANSHIDGSISARFQAWLDKVISRFIGAMVRAIIILTGVLVLISTSLFGIISLLIWPVLPLLPIVGLILSLLGWMPWIQ